MRKITMVKKRVFKVSLLKHTENQDLHAILIQVFLKIV
jgi:hypothetical protein